MTKKKNGEIVQEAMETLIHPDKIVEEGHSEQDYNKWNDIDLWVKLATSWHFIALHRNQYTSWK